MTHFSALQVDSLKKALVKLGDHINVKIVLSGLSFVGEFVFGAHKEALLVVFLLIILDTITGLIKASKKKEVSSRRFYTFASKLLVYTILMACASLVDKAIPIALAMPVIYTFLAATEGISIMENLSELGYPVPISIISRLKVMKKDEETQ